jgi:hypothetical protein
MADQYDDRDRHAPTVQNVVMRQMIESARVRTAASDTRAGAIEIRAPVLSTGGQRKGQNGIDLQSTNGAAGRIDGASMTDVLSMTARAMLTVDGTSQITAIVPRTDTAMGNEQPRNHAWARRGEPVNRAATTRIHTVACLNSSTRSAQGSRVVVQRDTVAPTTVFVRTSVTGLPITRESMRVTWR